MKNLRINRKLMVSFGAVGILLIGLIWVIMGQVADMRDMTDTAVHNRMEKMVQAQQMMQAATQFRTVEGVHLLVEDSDRKNAAEARMRELAAIVDRDRQALVESLKKADAQVLVGQFDKAWTQYMGVSESLTALSRAGQRATAIDLMTGQSQKTFDVMMRVGDDLTAVEKGYALSSGDAAVRMYSQVRLTAVVALLVALVLLGAILVMLVRQIAKPVSVATDALGQLADGNMDVTVPERDRADEVGDLARALVGLRDQLVAAEQSKADQTTLIVESIGKGLSGLAKGDLISRVDVELTGPFAKLKSDFNAAAAALQDTIANVAKAAGEINGGAGQVRIASDDLSQRTEQQAASLEETAAAMDEITATVRSTAERAGSANTAIRAVRQEAEHSGEVVQRAVDAMGAIERTSNEISEIISVIDGIAFQTNLLALNAGVEAARAGDAGKGFAVVASEVRALAQRSAEAAKDVKSRITTSGEQVAVGVQLVGETGNALSRIIEDIGKVDGLASEIADAASQQSSGLQQVNIAVSEMDGVTQQNAAMVEEATAAARSLAEEAEGMLQQIARFSIADTPAEASPVHALQARAAQAARTTGRTPLRSVGNTALVASDDWSEF